MSRIAMKLKLCLSSCLVYLLLTQRAYAYLDPGSASIILQSAIGAVAAAIATGGFYWRSIKDKLTRRFGRQREPEPEDDKD